MGGITVQDTPPREETTPSVNSCRSFASDDAPRPQVDIGGLEGFDKLPDAAFVRLTSVAALFSISNATVWRWCRLGRLPKPVRIGQVTLWNIGALRAAICTLVDAASSQKVVSGRPPGNQT